MKVYLLMECERPGWVSFDVPAPPSRILAVYSEPTAARARMASALPRFGVSLRIEEIEVDAPVDSPIDVGCACGAAARSGRQ